MRENTSDRRMTSVATNWAAKLRAELAQSAKRFANAQGVTSYESLGASPAVFFPADPDRLSHGNFIEKSYTAILANPVWGKRLEKVHSQRGALPENRRDGARELDSSNSSDALLMNCFCYPGAAERIFQSFLPSLPTGELEFGVAGRVPLRSGESDTTELDMRAGSVIFESKLTEADFTERPRTHVERYSSLTSVFDVTLLPQTDEAYQGYQLIRNVLGAWAHGYHFVLLCDGRRPDLLHEWWQVHAAIRTGDLRKRCGFLLWQEVASACPPPLREFLHAKYGM